MKTDFRSRIRHYISHMSEKKIFRELKSLVKVEASARVITAVITLPAILGLFLYSLCPLVLVTGYPCPACGMTRAGILVLKGHFAEAFHMQPFIYAAGAFVFAVAIHRWLLKRDSLEWAKWTLAAIITGMVIFYIYRMIHDFPDKPPMTYYPYNLIYCLRVLFRRL